MTLEPEEYVVLNQSEPENPSAIAFIQDNYENSKLRFKNVGIWICLSLLLAVHVTQICVGFAMITNCPTDYFVSTYFILAGIIGIAAKLSNFTIRRSRRYPFIHQIFYPIYGFELCWLFAGTYLYVLKVHDKTCESKAYTMPYWLIISSFICLKVCLLIFSWTISVIFALAYFKNKIVQYLAKSIRF